MEFYVQNLSSLALNLWEEIEVTDRWTDDNPTTPTSAHGKILDQHTAL